MPAPLTHKERILKWLAAAVVAAAVFNIAYTLYYSVIASETDEDGLALSGSIPVTEERADGEFTAASVPVRLVIPALGIDTDIIEVGLNSKGNMGVPKSYSKVGWYSLGPAPGARGNSVIAGHLDNGLGQAAVFRELDRLQPGDEVRVLDADGNTATFVVRHAKIFDYKASSTEEVFGATDKRLLNLITCNGAWIQGEKTYDKRYVVFTERII